MPKLKTHKGAADRFKTTGTGKVMRTRQGKSHLRRNKSAQAKKDFDTMVPVSHAEHKRLRKLLPYGAPR
jgi:large subunit ribosomal protein L35